MIITCTMTGIQFPVPQFSHIKEGSRVTGIHPFISLPVNTKLACLPKWAGGKLSPQEEQLLYVGLLNDLNLLDFRSECIPDKKVITQTMELLVSCVNWKTNSMHGNWLRDDLPRYIIQYPSSHTCENIHVFLNQLWNRKLGIETAYASRLENTATPEWRQREEQLRKLIRGGIKKNKRGEKSGLAEWALYATGITPKHELYDWWYSLLQLEAPKLFDVKLVEFAELLEHMQDKLEYLSRDSNSLAKAVLDRCRSIYKQAKDGPKGFYGIDDIDFTSAPQYLESLRKQAAIAPNSLPQRKLYPTQLSYLQALTAWHKKLELDNIEKERVVEYKKAETNITISNSLQSEETETIFIADIQQEVSIDFDLTSSSEE